MVPLEACWMDYQSFVEGSGTNKFTPLPRINPNSLVNCLSKEVMLPVLCSATTHSGSLEAISQANCSRPLNLSQKMARPPKAQICHWLIMVIPLCHSTVVPSSSLEDIQMVTPQQPISMRRRRVGGKDPTSRREDPVILLEC